MGRGGANLRHAMYWSPVTDAQPITGAIYEAWASCRATNAGPLGLPTSAEIQEPLQITQSFQHGTWNFERSPAVTEVVDGPRRHWRRGPRAVRRRCRPNTSRCQRIRSLESRVHYSARVKNLFSHFWLCAESPAHGHLCQAPFAGLITGSPGQMRGTTCSSQCRRPWRL